MFFLWHRPSSDTGVHLFLCICLTDSSSDHHPLLPLPSDAPLCSHSLKQCHRHTLILYTPSPLFYLAAWDSDAAPHLVIHVLLWWSDSGTTRLAENPSAELHRYHSETALPEQAELWCCRVCASLCLHVCLNDYKRSAVLCLWCAADIFSSHSCMNSA